MQQLSAHPRHYDVWQSAGLGMQRLIPFRQPKNRCISGTCCYEVPYAFNTGSRSDQSAGHSRTLGRHGKHVVAGGRGWEGTSAARRPSFLRSAPDTRWPGARATWSFFLNMLPGRLTPPCCRFHLRLREGAAVSAAVGGKLRAAGSVYSRCLPTNPPWTRRIERRRVGPLTAPKAADRPWARAAAFALQACRAWQAGVHDALQALKAPASDRRLS